MVQFYNLTKVSADNDFIGFYATLSDVMGFWFGVMLVVLMFLIPLIVLLKKGKDINTSLHFSSLISGLLAIFLFAGGILGGYSLAIYILSTNLNNGTHNFSFNSSFWSIGNNSILINCTDSSSTIDSSILLFVDTILPEILYINYSIGNDNFDNVLNGSLFSIDKEINFQVATTDTNNFFLNVTVFDPNGKSIFSNQAVNVSKPLFIFNNSINLTNEISGLYSMNVTSKDAHTLISINRGEELKDKPINDISYLGKEYDDSLKTYIDKTKITKFDTISENDRDKFDVTFQKGVTLFDIYIEGKSSVFYVGEKYGYKGHIIVDNHYWHDLENKDGAEVVSVTKVNDLKYKVTMTKPSNVDRIIFNSVGIINTVTESITFQYLFSIVNVSLRDSGTKELITSNITVQYVGTKFQDEKKTITGSTSFNVSFDALSESVSLRAFSNQHTDYSLVIRDFTLTQGEDSNIVLYLTNTSDTATTTLITFIVQDEESNPIQGASIRISRQDPSTNTLLKVTDLTTDSDGQAITILEVDTVFYSWTVEFEGQRIYTLPSPVTLSIDNTRMRILGVITQGYTEKLNKQLRVIRNVYILKISNTSARFFFNFSSDVSINACLDVQILNSSGNFSVERPCVNSTSGSVQSSIFTPDNRTFYEARAFADFKDNLGFVFLDKASGYIGQLSEVLTSNVGLIIPIIVILFAGVGFLSSISMGLIILAVGFIIIPITGIVPQITVLTSMLIVSLCAISIFTINRLRT